MVSFPNWHPGTYFSMHHLPVPDQASPVSNLDAGEFVTDVSKVMKVAVRYSITKSSHIPKWSRITPLFLEWIKDFIKITHDSPWHGALSM
jgi:hypothetical protein